jgi:hypothetical protein
MLLENMLDASNLVLRLALCKLRRGRRAVDNGTIARKLGDLRKLLHIRRLLLRSGGCLGRR